MLSLSDNNQADAIEALNSTSRYLDDLPLIRTKGRPGTCTYILLNFS